MLNALHFRVIHLQMLFSGFFLQIKVIIIGFICYPIGLVIQSSSVMDYPTPINELNSQSK